MALNSYPKVYIHGAIGRQREIDNLFKTLNANNPVEYKFNDPSFIYFINKENNISIAEKGSDLYDIIENSNEWKELKLKHPKKERKFIVTVRDGSNSCDGCEVYGKCTEQQKTKCQLARLLGSLMEGVEVSGKKLEVSEVEYRNGWVKID